MAIMFQIEPTNRQSAKIYLNPLAVTQAVEVTGQDRTLLHVGGTPIEVDGGVDKIVDQLNKALLFG